MYVHLLAANIYLLLCLITKKRRAKWMIWGRNIGKADREGIKMRKKRQLNAAKKHPSYEPDQTNTHHTCSLMIYAGAPKAMAP